MQTLIFYDTETTGTNTEKDRVIEIAAYNGSTGESFSSYINPGIPIPKEASNIHGITDDMVSSSPTFPVVFEQFAAFCGSDSVLVAHNNYNFDYPLLLKECQRHSLPLFQRSMIDSLKWAQKYRADLPKHTLQYLAQVYGYTVTQTHRALDDVLLLHKIFSILTGDLTPNQIIALLNETAHPKVFKMPFGKYRGKPLTEVPQSYLKWLEDQGALDKVENKELKEIILSMRT